MFSFLKRNKVQSVNINKIDEILSEIKLIDIREPYETKMGSIKGARKVPMNTLLKNPEQYINKEEEYYIMCQSGMRSSKVVNILNEKGYKTINVIGGFGSYVGNKIQ